MSKQTTTKEQLITDLAITRDNLDNYIEQDEKIRKEFAKAFNWTERGLLWSVDNKPVVPTWEQIFVQVGVLLSADKFVKVENNLFDLSTRMQQIEKILDKDNQKEPNF